MSRNQAAKLLDPLPLPAFIWDIDTEKFIGGNQLLLDLLGYTADELYRLDWRQLVVADEIHVAERAIAAGPRMQAVRWHWRKKDRHVIEVTLSTRESVFVDDGGETRDVYMGLVIGVGKQPSSAAGEVF